MGLRAPARASHPVAPHCAAPVLTAANPQPARPTPPRTGEEGEARRVRGSRGEALRQKQKECVSSPRAPRAATTRRTAPSPATAPPRKERASGPISASPRPRSPPNRAGARRVIGGDDDEDDGFKVHKKSAGEANSLVRPTRISPSTAATARRVCLHQRRAGVLRVKGWENQPTRCVECKNAKKARFGEGPSAKPVCYAFRGASAPAAALPLLHDPNAGAAAALPARATRSRGASAPAATPAASPTTPTPTRPRPQACATRSRRASAPAATPAASSTRRNKRESVIQ